MYFVIFDSDLLIKNGAFKKGNVFWKKRKKIYYDNFFSYLNAGTDTWD